MNIPAGYSLTVTSWENDADCYKTQVFHGLKAEEVRCLVALARLFKSMHGHEPGFGGGAWHYTGGAHRWKADIIAAYDTVIAEFEAVLSESFLAQWKVQLPEEEDDFLFDSYREQITELVGYAEDENYSDDYIRVYDCHTVHYYETSVPDLTEEFK